MKETATKHNIAGVIYYITITYKVAWPEKPSAHATCVIIQQITFCAQSIKMMPVEDLLIKELFVWKDTLVSHCSVSNYFRVPITYLQPSYRPCIDLREL